MSASPEPAAIAVPVMTRVFSPWGKPARELGAMSYGFPQPQPVGSRRDQHTGLTGICRQSDSGATCLG